MRQSVTNTGKVFDPVFMFMLVAVGLAVASSFALRAVVTGMGPASAHAAEGPLDQQRVAGSGGVESGGGQASPAMAAGTSR